MLNTIFIQFTPFQEFNYFYCIFSSFKPFLLEKNFFFSESINFICRCENISMVSLQTLLLRAFKPHLLYISCICFAVITRLHWDHHPLPFLPLSGGDGDGCEGPAYSWRVVSRSHRGVLVVNPDRGIRPSWQHVADPLHVDGWTWKSQFLPTPLGWPYARKADLQQQFPQVSGLTFIYYNEWYTRIINLKVFFFF